MSKIQENYSEWASKCETLDDLLDCLQEISARIDEHERVEDAVDLTSLPHYSEHEPANTAGVWSWDETRLLIGEGGVDEWSIVERGDVHYGRRITADHESLLTVEAQDAELDARDYDSPRDLCAALADAGRGDAVEAILKS